MIMMNIMVIMTMVDIMVIMIVCIYKMCGLIKVILLLFEDCVYIRNIHALTTVSKFLVNG